jgi:hypothetical protein
MIPACDALRALSKGDLVLLALTQALQCSDLPARQFARILLHAEMRRIGHLRLRPNREGGGRSGATIAHSASAGQFHSVGPRGYAARLVEVHMSSSSKASNTCLESHLSCPSNPPVSRSGSIVK